MMEEHSEPSLIFHSDPGRESHPIMSSEISVRFKHGKKTPFLEEGEPQGIIEGDATSLCLQIVKLEEDTHFKDELNPGERTTACTADVTPDVVLQIKPDAELDCKDEQSCIQIGLDNTSWTGAVSQRPHIPRPPLPPLAPNGPQDLLQGSLYHPQSNLCPTNYLHVQ